MNTDENLRYYMDETSAPYPENECPYPWTKEDDAFDEMIIEKYHLNTEDFQPSQRMHTLSDFLHNA